MFIDDFKRWQANTHLREVSGLSQSPADMSVNAKDWLAWTMQSEPGDRNGWKIRFCRKMSPYTFQLWKRSWWIQSDASTDSHSTALSRCWSRLWWVLAFVLISRRWWCNESNFYSYRVLAMLLDWDTSSARSESAWLSSMEQSTTSNITRTWVNFTFRSLDL